jgi:hypothetical protein
MSLPISIHYGKADRGPDFIVEVNEGDGSIRDISAATGVKFYVRDNVAETMIVDGSTDGVSVVPTNKLKRIIQPADTAAEIADGSAWFTYSLGGKEESTFAVTFLVSERWKRVML